MDWFNNIDIGSIVRILTIIGAYVFGIFNTIMIYKLETRIKNLEKEVSK